MKQGSKAGPWAKLYTAVEKDSAKAESKISEVKEILDSRDEDEDEAEESAENMDAEFRLADYMSTENHNPDKASMSKAAKASKAEASVQTQVNAMSESEVKALAMSLAK